MRATLLSCAGASSATFDGYSRATDVHTLTKVIFISIGVWWFTLIALFLFPVPFLTWFSLLISLLVAFVLLSLSLVALFKDKRRQWPALLMVIVVLTVYFALVHLTYFGAFANFYLHRRYYETTARLMVIARSDAERKQICGNGCWLMSSDPSRVGFHYVDGFLNWNDIVYDPSGGVIAPMSIDEKLRMDIYFRSAEHLTGNWYLCHFSD